MTDDDAAFGEELVRLASADNFRDVAGTGYPTAGGGRVRRGVFFRSNELTLTDEDARALGITAIYDLRDEHEVAGHPDAPVPGATWEHLEVKGIPMDSVATLADRDEATEVMGEVYRGFVTHPGAREAFAALLKRLAGSEAPQLFHCTAGKDRTGWASMLLLHLAGVQEPAILDDYLLTNTVATATREKYLALVSEHLGADKAVEAAYGSLTGYLRDGLGLSESALAALRGRLVARS